MNFLKKFTYLVLFLIFVFTNISNAKNRNSMRRCMLLPMTDSVGGAIAFKVFLQVEEYIRESNWCYYKPNSEIINILGAYKKNLKKHLENKEVLRVIADKVQAGSLILVDIVSQINGNEIQIKIYGEDGEDLYFKEKALVKSEDVAVLASTITSWLDIYSKSIPYDGRLTGIIGRQFTIDVGREFGILPGSGVTVYRALNKTRHPLLKEIVEWRKESIGEGEIFHVSRGQSQGKIQHYHSKKRLALNDWVLIDKKKQSEKSSRTSFDIDEKESFGKLGTVGLLMNAGTGSATSTMSSTDVRKIGGTLFGIDLIGELWITRELWAAMEIGRRFGSYKEIEGNLVSTSDNSTSNRSFKLKFGYKYLPLGFFYGPQVDGYIGYASYTYGLNAQINDGFGEVSYSGTILGVKGSLPVQRQITLFLELEFMLTSSYEENIVIFGEDESSSNYHIRMGGSYIYDPGIKIDASYAITANEAEFATQEVKHKESIFRIGPIFTF